MFGPLSRSLPARIVASICLALLIVTATATAAAISYAGRDARRALADRARQTVALLAGGAAEALWNMDAAAAAALLAPLERDPDFAGARIADADGTTFVELGRFVPAPVPFVPAPASFAPAPFAPAPDAARDGPVSPVRKNDAGVAARGPVVERAALLRVAVVGGRRESRTIGALTLQLTDARAERLMRERAAAIAAAGAGVLTAVCGLLAFLMTGVAGRIRQVTEAMTALAAGRLDGPSPPADRPDELGRMAAALSTLKLHAVERLGFIERQAKHVEEVERTVAERTAALRRTLETLQRAQDELVRSEKLAALGGMVAAMAHEINTPLGNGLTVATTLVDKAADFSRTVEGKELRRSVLRRCADDFGAAAALLSANLLRAADLIGRFKRVAVDRTGEVRRTFELDVVCAETVAMLRPGYKHAAPTIATDLPTGATMDGYPGALGQVLTNLIANAMIHGFDDGTRPGTVTVAATVRPGDPHATLTVEDDGAGIPPDALPRIFDPFFTTRLGSGGSGLGLHIVYATVAQVLGGAVAVESEIGRGTRFTVVLPLVAPAAPASAAHPVD